MTTPNQAPKTAADLHIAAVQTANTAVRAAAAYYERTTPNTRAEAAQDAAVAAARAQVVALAAISAALQALLARTDRRPATP